MDLGPWETVTRFARLILGAVTILVAVCRFGRQGYRWWRNKRSRRSQPER